MFRTISGKLVIMFSNLSDTGRFSREIQECRRVSLHYCVTSVNIKKLPRLVGYITREDATDFLTV